MTTCRGQASTEGPPCALPSAPTCGSQHCPRVPRQGLQCRKAEYVFPKVLNGRAKIQIKSRFCISLRFFHDPEIPLPLPHGAQGLDPEYGVGVP